MYFSKFHFLRAPLYLSQKFFQHTLFDKSILLLIFFFLLLHSSPANSDTLSENIKKGDQYFLSYDKNLGNLTKAIEHYRKATEENNPAVRYEAYWKMANTYMTSGDIEKYKSKRIEYYQNGKDAAWEGIMVNPDMPDNHFWYFANLAKLSKLKGKMSLIFAVSKMKKHINLALKNDPDFVYAINGKAILLQDLPSYAGGNLKKSEEMFKKAIELQPNLSSPHLHLAELYIKTGREKEAREQLKKILGLKNPTWKANWIVRYKPTAERLLDKLNNQLSLRSDPRPPNLSIKETFHINGEDLD